MAVNRVDYGGNTLIDLSADTVIAEALLSGFTAHGADGEPITGTADGAHVAVTTKAPSSNATSIAFTGLTAKPKAFMLIATTQITLATTYYVTAVMSSELNTYGTYVRKGSGGGSSAYNYVSSSYFSWTYEDGTLTVSTQSSTRGGYFKSSVTYRLIYVY